MANMQPTKVPMPEQCPVTRARNWKEVACGYSEADAIEEAGRCLACKHRPCMSGCPVGVRIPEFIAEVAKGNFAAAYQIIKTTNALPAVCGRVCPQESQCEGKCVRAIKGESVGIGRLERFCADWAAAHPEALAPATCAPSNGKRVAVVGSGPSGLTCAKDLAELGYAVTVFEALHTAGGVLVYGIPEFRLPKQIVANEIASLEKMGVQFACNMVIGRVFSVDELFADGYSAVFIGTGAGLPQFLGIPGESGNGVYSANEFLTRINLMKAYREEFDTPIRPCHRVAVVGGGNVAMDAARCAKRLGAEEVTIVYRRSEAEMPARKEEVHHAKEEGILFRTLSNPTAILTDENGDVVAMECQAMQLGEPDAGGRRGVTAISDSTFSISVDTVIMAVGTSPNPLIRLTTPGLSTNRRGCIVTAADGVSTSRDGVFAGGDAVTGAATVILAMGAGKEAASAIHSYLSAEE